MLVTPECYTCHASACKNNGWISVSQTEETSNQCEVENGLGENTVQHASPTSPCAHVYCCVKHFSISFKFDY